ncbi:SdrD B-like domain-containing protein [Microbacterium halotolerans]|uniref:SdrD B-like domain-containing protein n=1 Tax=Microbacterium halotolerans TaxID=246613 RepID=UPI000E6AAA0A|nr:SdrD B-like domain-containing protein [Microbacterium halotolerans]
MKRALAGAATVSTVAALAAFGGAAAHAETTDGTIIVHVTEDRNLNGQRDAVDAMIDGATVTVTDSEGASATAVTVAGAAEIDSTALTGGTYRVEVTNPDPATYTESTVDPAATDETAFGPAVSFADVADGADATVEVGYVDLSKLGVENGQVFSALQDNMASDAQETELYSLPANLQGSQAELTGRGSYGTVYGIGVDSGYREIYAGAYAKRAAEYGPGGAGGIYRYDALDGEDDGLWAVVRDAGSTTHDWDADQDFDFRDRVSREGLGDIEVTEDNAFLTTVNLARDMLVTYDLSDRDTAAADRVPVQELAVPASLAGVDSDADFWTPFALEEHDGELYVGATDGETMDVYLLNFTRAADGSLSFAGVVASGNAGDVLERQGQETADRYVNEACRYVDWNEWHDDVPDACINDRASGWNNGNGYQLNYAQPLLADIEVIADGEFAFSFRDRSSDQYGTAMIYGFNADGEPESGDYILTGDLVQVTLADDQIQWAPDFDYVDRAGSNADLVHAQGSFSGIAYVPELDYVLTNQLDANQYFTQGLRVLHATGDSAGQVVRNDDVPTGNIDLTGDFGKNTGLADVEVLVAAATQQIGNYVWIDSDKDGVQDPDEAPVEGVTVTLRDTDGNVVATTVTDADGAYYFGAVDGLEPDTEYDVVIDASNFTDGALVGYHATEPQADGATDVNDSNGVQAESSDETVARITTPAANVNDHSIDFGFVEDPTVSVGDYVWFDSNRDGRQGDDESGIEGVELTLTGPDGNPVTDVFGNPVEPTSTDEDGKYSFDDLPVLPEGEHYTVTVTPPNGFEPTEPDVGDGEGDSSTGSAESGDLTEDGARDDTLDFGFVKPTVSVGDYVWFDSNRDGRQDDDESGIEGVELTLTGPDGKPVTDVFGDPVEPTSTDEDGKYSFDDLPVLPEGEHYTVTVTPPNGFESTEPGVGDGEGDSSTGSAESGDLTEDGARDDTLDFGFVVIEEPTDADGTDGTDGTTSPNGSDDDLAVTGGTISLAAGAAALLLLLIGGGLITARRRSAMQD